MQKKTLEKQGHTVKEINHPDKVCKDLEQNTYDLLLMDIRMPGTSGIELYHTIIDKCPDLTNKVIFITGDTEDMSTRHFLEKNQLEFLRKPFGRTELCEAIGRIINR